MAGPAYVMPRMRLMSLPQLDHGEDTTSSTGDAFVQQSFKNVYGYLVMDFPSVRLKCLILVS